MGKKGSTRIGAMCLQKWKLKGRGLGSHDENKLGDIMAPRHSFFLAFSTHHFLFDSGAKVYGMGTRVSRRCMIAMVTGRNAGRHEGFEALERLRQRRYTSHPD